MFRHTTVTSEVDICAECGTSRSHYLLINHLSRQEVEGEVVVLLQANKAAKRPSHASGYLKGHLETFQAGFVAIFNGKSDHLNAFFVASETQCCDMRDI